MLSKGYVVLLIVSNAIGNVSLLFQSFYGIKIKEYPKSSCHEIADITSKGKCLGTCGTIMDNIVMISHDESTKTCMCCNDITGSDKTGPKWKSYAQRTCKYLSA